MATGIKSQDFVKKLNGDALLKKYLNKDADFNFQAVKTINDQSLFFTLENVRKRMNGERDYPFQKSRILFK